MDSIETSILGYFQSIPHIVSVILFGSYARNDFNQRSDVDIAILCERTHVPLSMTLIEWREDLSSLLQKEVDLVCLNTASSILGMQVYQDGRILIVRNTREYANYQMLLFTEYAELKEIRAPMEQNILKRKFYDQS